MKIMQKIAFGAVIAGAALGLAPAAEAQQYYYPQQGYYYQQPPVYVPPRVQRKQQQLSDRFIEKYGYQPTQPNYGYRQPRYYQPQPQYYQPQPQYYQQPRNRQRIQPYGYYQGNNRTVWQRNQGGDSRGGVSQDR